jgi:hypothetical protein
MADTALERYNKDVQQQEKVEKTKPGEIRTLNEFQSSFLKALENVGEPTKTCKISYTIKRSFQRFKKSTRH